MNSLRNKTTLPRNLLLSITAAIRVAPVFRKFFYRLANYPIKKLHLTSEVDTKFGMTMLCDTNDFVQRMIANFGFWEPDITELFGRILKPGDVVVDVGANVGYYTLLSAVIVGHRGLVIAIEPHPTVFLRLQENVKCNGLKNVECVQVAAGDSEGEIDLFTGPSSGLGLSTTVYARGFDLAGKVKLRPLIDLVPPDVKGRVALIKIDVEGGEPPILENILANIELLPSTVCVLVELSTEMEAASSLFHSFISHGFMAYGVENNYDDSYYLNFKSAAQPVRLMALPAKQVDVLFTRSELV